MNKIGERDASGADGPFWFSMTNPRKCRLNRKKGLLMQSINQFGFSPSRYDCCCRVTALCFRGTPSSEFWKASVNVKRTWPLRSYQHVCWCIHSQGKGSVAHQKQEKKKKKIVIHWDHFLKEQFTDAQEWTALMPQREGGNEDEKDFGAHNDLFPWLLFSSLKTWSALFPRN